MAPIDIEFDPEKDRRNLAKHGVSLAKALDLSWEELVVLPDRRIDYGEERFIGYGKLGIRLYCVIFVLRHGTVRIVSLRKANDREIKRYDQSKDAIH
ncbi:MAG: hypothetical protein RLZZ393_537 [Pseudomonadota bacterium]